MNIRLRKCFDSFIKLCCLGLFFIIFLMVLLSGHLPVEAASIKEGVTHLTDLQNHWASTQITRLVALDIVNGYPDHTFQPDQQVSQLETTVLLLRSGGFAAEAERVASGGLATPRVPWGQQYLDLAVQKGFLSNSDTINFDFAAPATRLWAAKLLAHVLYLTPPAAHSGVAPDVIEMPGGTGYAVNKSFSDELQLDSDDLSCVRAVAAAGVMSGYPDGTFQPFAYLTRAEMSVIISRLMDQGWMRVNAEKSLTGWISRIGTQKGSLELELTSLGKTQKFKVDQGVCCFKANQEYPIEQASDYIGEIILDKKKQVSWVNLLQQKSSPQNPVIIRGSVKSVALGRDNLLILGDLICQERILHLDGDAVMAGEKAPKDFTALKPGTFVDLETDQDEVKKVTVIEVKNISGQVESLSDGRLYLKGASSTKKPEWLNNYEFARIVDKDGVGKGALLPGDNVQITYIDPIPEGIDDEIPLEIKITK